MRSLANSLARRPWILVILAFVILLGAWSALIMIAMEHAPQALEVSPPAPAAQKP